MGIEGVALEHHGDVARLGRQVRHVATLDHDPPGVRRLQPCQEPQQGRFSATRRPDQDQELAIADGEIDVVQHANGAEALLQADDVDGRHARLSLPFFIRCRAPSYVTAAGADQARNARPSKFVKPASKKIKPPRHE
jgi:hypothetical protein